MDKFTLERDFDNELKSEGTDTREPKKIVFNVPKDLNIYEYRIMCIRMAQATGFGEENVIDAFGPVDVPYYMVDEDIEIRKHIFDLMHDEEKIGKFIQDDESVSSDDENMCDDNDNNKKN
jgi:hypothetical protein